MGRQSREKKERREREEIKPRKRREIRPVMICKGLILFSFFLILFTPLIGPPLTNSFYFPFVGPKSLYFMGLVEIIFFAWLILIIYFPQYRPTKNSVFFALILFLVVSILSSLFGENFSYSFWSKPERMTGLLMWLHLFAFFLVISSVFRKREDWQKIFAISIFVGVILSLITFFSDDLTMKGGATIGNDSFLGTYLLFNLFFALYLILTPYQKFGEGFTAQKEIKIYSTICFLIIFLGLFLSGARAAKLSFLGGLVLLSFLFLAFKTQKKYLQILGKALLVFSFFVFLISLFLLFKEGSIVNQKFIELATESRLVVWEKAWKGFLERPWLGWGLENFEFVFTKYFNPCMFLPECGGEIWFDRAHNIILDTLITTGILGLLTYLGIFLSSFYLLWRNYFRKKIEFWTVGIFSVLLISYSVQNLTVFDMVSSYLMFFLVLGFISSITVPREVLVPQKTIFPNSLLLSFIFILFLFSFFYFIIQPLKTDYYALFTFLRVPPASEERLNFYKKTLQASLLGKYQIRDFFGQKILEFTQSEKVKEVSVENFKKEIDFVIEELEKSIKESPLDFRSYLKLGQLYNVYTVLLDEAKVSEAERVLEKAIEFSPTNQQGYWSLAQTRLYQKKFKEALSLAEKALSLEPRLFQSHRIVIQIAKIMGDNELVQKKIKEAIEINPGWEEELKKVG